MRGPEADCDFEILAHAHAEKRQTLRLRKLGEQSKMGAGILARGRNAHQAFDGKIQLVARKLDERRRIRGRRTGLLRFFSGIDLHENNGRASAAVDFATQSERKLGAVERMDAVEQFDRFARFVRLQRSDQMKFDVGEFLAQGGPFGFRFLHAIFAECAMTGRQYGFDTLRIVCLGDGNERGRSRRLDRRLSRLLDARNYIGERKRRIARFGHDWKGHCVADALARAKLARLARQLNASSIRPHLVLMTDDARLPDPRAAAEFLPRGSLIVLRTRDDERRLVTAAALARIAHRRGLFLSIADDPVLAARLGANGVHFPQARIGEIAYWRARRPHWFVTASAHSLNAAALAVRFGADAVFLSPVFATKSHPERAPLGGIRLRLMAQTIAADLYALGGIDAQTARCLVGARLAGLAAIGGLTP